MRENKWSVLLKWMKRFKEERVRFILCTHRVKTGKVLIVVRKGPSIDKKVWEKKYKPEIKNDRLQYNYWYSGWPIMQISAKQLAFIFRKT